MRDESQRYLRRIFGENSSKLCDLSARNLRNMRTVRSILKDDKRDVIVKKHYINLNKSDMSKVYKNENATAKNLDTILDDLGGSIWPASIALLITPSSRHNDQYKLHVIDCEFKNHLGMTSITKAELKQIQTNEAYQKYSIIVGNKYMNLKTLAKTMGNMLSGIIASKHQADNSGYLCKSGHDWYKRSSKSTQCALELNRKPQYQFKHTLSNFQEDISHGNILRYFESLIERINHALWLPDKELEQFFAIAEECKLNIYIRPELCWKSTFEPVPMPVSKSNLIKSGLFFILECFTVFENYIGCITLDDAQVQQYLSEHPQLLQRVNVINDVYEIIPIPSVMVRFIRAVCDRLGLEWLYDAFGEFLFDLLK